MRFEPGKARGMVDKDFSWRRCFAWTCAIGGHVVLLVALSLPLRLEPPPVPAVAERPQWIDDARVTPVELPPAAVPATVAPADRRLPPPAVRTRRRIAEAARDVAEPRPDTPPANDAAEAPLARPLVFLDDTGRAQLLDEPLYASSPPARTGDWHTPGDGSEDDVFYRPLALDPQTTRFARAWRPAQTLGGEWYERLVQATAGKVSIPLSPKFSLVCGGSIAGLGGGCAIVRIAGSGVVVERGDPPPWERSNRVQCRELRDELAAAVDAERVAFLLDRLTALCTAPDAAAVPPAETTKPGTGPGSGG